jgi:hypothetical protein
MRRVEPGEVPPDGDTAAQMHPDRPIFSGRGPDDHVCVGCGNVPAVAMPPEYVNRKPRIRCARCRTVSVAIEVPGVDYRAAFKRPG